MFTDSIERKNDQKIPELFAIVEIRIMSVDSVPTKTLHRNLCDVFSIDSSVGIDFQFLLSKLDDSLVVPLPDCGDGTAVTSLEFPQPV